MRLIFVVLHNGENVSAMKSFRFTVITCAYLKLLNLIVSVLAVCFNSTCLFVPGTNNLDLVIFVVPWIA